VVFLKVQIALGGKIGERKHQTQGKVSVDILVLASDPMRRTAPTIGDRKLGSSDQYGKT